MSFHDAKSFTALNSGWGHVNPEVQVSLALPASLALCGGSQDFFSGIFNAAHRINRHAGSDGYVAVGLPEMRPGVMGLQALGESVLLVGALSSIAQMLDDTRLDRATKTRLRHELDYDPAPHVQAPMGKALVRTRKDDNWAPGRVANRIERLDRSIAATSDPDRKAMLGATRERVLACAEDRWENRAPVDAFMQFGRVSMGMMLVDAAPSPDGRILASTWGLSHPEAPMSYEMAGSQLRRDDRKARRDRYFHRSEMAEA